MFTIFPFLTSGGFEPSPAPSRLALGDVGIRRARSRLFPHHRAFPIRRDAVFHSCGTTSHQLHVNQFTDFTNENTMMMIMMIMMTTKKWENE